jgi:hypothetical protein
MKLFFEAALERGTVAASAKIALLVGSILALINYGDRILYRDMHAVDWFKLVVTYCVPYGAAKYATRHARDKGNKTPGDSDSS